MAYSIGDRVDGRYDLLAELGRGVQGTIFRALDRETGERVALKCLHATIPDRVFEERLLREAQVLDSLGGTAAVRLLRASRAPDATVYLALEELDGETLEGHAVRLADQGETLRPADVHALLAPVAETLSAAHALGVIHRDLKPANIFVQRDGRVRLLDFGMAKVLGALPLTGVGVIIGSPAYVSPEALSPKAGTIDEQTDVYSLVAVAFRLLAGRPPFEGRSFAELVPKIVGRARPSVRAARADVSEALDQWIARGLAVDRAQRHRSVREAWAALDEVARG